MTRFLHRTIPVLPPVHLCPRPPLSPPTNAHGTVPQLCAKQQKVTFLTWQLNIVLDFFVASLTPEATANPTAAAVVTPAAPGQSLPSLVPSAASSLSPSRSLLPAIPLPCSSPSPPALGRRDCARALAQLLYENGDRLGTRFDDVLPPLLGLADPSTDDLETRWAIRIVCFITGREGHGDKSSFLPGGLGV